MSKTEHFLGLRRFASHSGAGEINRWNKPGTELFWGCFAGGVQYHFAAPADYRGFRFLTFPLVILRQRSLRQAKGLPTKDLCISASGGAPCLAAFARHGTLSVTAFYPCRPDLPCFAEALSGVAGCAAFGVDRVGAAALGCPTERSSAARGRRVPHVKLRYLHRNPVKRGLVSRRQYRTWSSSRHNALRETGVGEIESEWTARAREGTEGVYLRPG